jgi:hypothetical protein
MLSKRVAIKVGAKSTRTALGPSKSHSDTIAVTVKNLMGRRGSTARHIQTEAKEFQEKKTADQ